MRVASFHSKLRGTAVYHNNNECTEGNNIEPKNLVKGTGGLRLCKRCDRENRRKRR